MKRNIYSKKIHPAQRSLSIFPLVPQSKTNLVSAHRSFQPENHCAALSSTTTSSTATTTTTTRFRKSHKNVGNLCKKVRIHFETSPVPSATIKNNTRQGVATSTTSNADENLIHATKIKLEYTEKHLPKRNQSHESFSLKLPPIPAVPGFPPSVKGSAKKTSKEIPSNVSKQKWNPCTCGRQKEITLHNQLDEMKLKDIARTLRAEETPHMFSVYVRWKTERDGTSDYDYHSLVDTFETFGTLSNIVFKSPNSAVVVFTDTKSACTAAKVIQKVGRELKLFVKWLKDI